MGVGELVGVLVGVLVAVLVGVLVGVIVGVFVGVFVGVLVAVFVGVIVGVFVGVLVGVLVGVTVGVFVGVSVGPSTVMLAKAAFPVPPLVEVMLPLVLFLTPDVMPLIPPAVRKHDPPAATVPPVMLMVSVPTNIAVPLQLPLKPLGVPTINPDGKVSVNDTPVRAVPALGLV